MEFQFLRGHFHVSYTALMRCFRMGWIIHKKRVCIYNIHIYLYQFTILFFFAHNNREFYSFHFLFWFKSFVVVIFCCRFDLNFIRIDHAQLLVTSKQMCIRPLICHHRRRRSWNTFHVKALTRRLSSLPLGVFP